MLYLLFCLQEIEEGFVSRMNTYFLSAGWSWDLALTDWLCFEEAASIVI